VVGLRISEASRSRVGKSAPNHGRQGVLGFPNPAKTGYTMDSHHASISLMAPVVVHGDLVLFKRGVVHNCWEANRCKHHGIYIYREYQTENTQHLPTFIV